MEDHRLGLAQDIAALREMADCNKRQLETLRAAIEQAEYMADLAERALCGCTELALKDWADGRPAKAFLEVLRTG